MAGKDVKIIFVLPSTCETELDASEEMQQAFEACRQNGVEVNWSKDADCPSLELRKTDFLVFQTFEGESFKTVQQTKSARIVGPWCLLACLTDGTPIPNFPWPIYSVAMRDCRVTTSSIPRPQRKELQEKIEYMGGYFSPDLTDSCTHLITDSVKSEKYTKAAEAGLKLVLASWVDEVWKACRSANIQSSDKQFMAHFCRPFHKLIVCCTGLEMAERTRLASIVADNGGTYRDQLHVLSTDILVCGSNSTTSAKYKGAKKHKVYCVNFDWISDSVASGYAMPVKDALYQVEAVGTSTPTKDAANQLPNFSTISNIDNSRLMASDTTINATNITKLTGLTPAKATPSLKRKSNSNEHNDLVDEIDVKQVKKIGPFLDGCGIYLAGFGAEQREKLCKVLNFGGATRYDEVSERVTHVVTGDASSHEFRLLMSKDAVKNCPIVNVHWLLDSIAKKCPVNEANYLVITVVDLGSEPDSPLSKKSLHLLRSGNNTPKPNTLKPADAKVTEEPEVDIVQHYLPANASSQEDTLAKLLQDDADKFQQPPSSNFKQPEAAPSTPNQSTHSNLHQSVSVSQRDASLSSAVDDSSQPADPIFEGLKFIVAGFAEENSNQLHLVIEEMAGSVVSPPFHGVTDYAVVPAFDDQIKQPAREVVTDLWISECWQENEIQPIDYYHRPFFVKNGQQPLKDCVVTISGYANYERNFLKLLIIELGGVAQEQFSRIVSEKSGLVACTHLVSPEASGKKYEAAIKWGLPVVTKDWLLECGRISDLPSESPFLVGKAKCSASRTLSTTSAASTPGIKNSSTKSTVSSYGDTNNRPMLPVLESLRKSDTPTHKKPDSSSSELTPDNRQSSPVCSQITPVQKIMDEVRKKHLLGTPTESLPCPSPWDYVKTPDTPLGAFIHPNPSPELRKEMVRWLNRMKLPEYKPRRESTPLSELKRRLWDKICPPRESQRPEQPDFEGDDEVFVGQGGAEAAPAAPSTPDHIINHQLQELQEMLASSSGTRNSTNSRRQSTVPVAANRQEKDSQPNTIGWDDDMDYENVPPKSQQAVFMVSGIEQEKRDAVVALLESLGASVSNLPNFDPLCTHVVCPKPMRNEKILACMASGKWILHLSYVDQCAAEGRLVDEEPFEYGNPKARSNTHMQGDKETEARMAAMHYWRKEIARRGYGPFHDMRIIIIAAKRDPIVRIVQAGGGMVVDASLPFTQPIHATHCLLDVKSVTNMSDYVPLAKQGIFCVSTLFVSEVLQRTVVDVRDRIIPALVQYYQ